MQLVRFWAAGAERFGIVRDDHFVDLSGQATDLRDLATRHMCGPAGAAIIQDWAERAPSFACNEATLLVPLQGDYRVFCLAVNYHEHARETGLVAYAEPLVFFKLPSTLINPDEDIVRPAITQALDYEGELAVVIGQAGRDIAEREALDYVLGYCVLNDVSARDLQRREVDGRRLTDWLSGKALDATTPVGPYITTADEVGDAGDLRLVTRLNGNVVQDDRTSAMVNSIPQQISYISQRVRLRPLDVIATGTPARVGGRTGGKLQHGDVVEIEIERVGRLANRVVVPGVCD